MKHRFLIAAALAAVPLGGSVQAQQQETLADHLPAGTQFYFEIPDVGSFLEDSRNSSLGRIWNDPQVQEFLQPALALLEEPMQQARARIEMMGLPPELLSWQALDSVALGFGVSASGGPSPDQPAVVASAAVGFREGLAEPLFGFLSGMLQAQVGATLEDSEYGPILVIPFEGEEVRLLHVPDHLVLWMELGHMGDGQGSLAASPAFQRAREQGLVPGSELFLYVDFSAFLDTGLEMAARNGDNRGVQLMRSIWDRIGLTSMGAMTISSGWREDGSSVSRVALGFDEGGPKGVFQSAPGPLDTSLLSYIPANATSFSLATDHSEVDPWSLMDSIVSEITAMEVQPGTTLADLWQQSGHPSWEWMRGSKAEVMARGLRGFGRSMVSFSVTDEAAMMSMGGQGAAFLEVRDPAAVREWLDGFLPDVMSWVSEAGVELPIHLESRRVSIRERNEAGELVTREGPQYFVIKIDASTLPPEMAQLSFFLAQIQPSFGVTDDGWLVMSLNSGEVRRYLRTGVQKQEPDIRSNADVQAFLQRVPKDAISISWSDPRPGLRAAITMVQNLVPMFAAQLPPEVPIDFQKMPSPDAIVSHLRPSEVVNYYGPGGSLVTDSVGSFDLVDVFLLAGAGLSVAPMVAMGLEREPAEALTEPSSEPAGETAAEGVSAARRELERLRTGLIVFQIENGRWPSSLEELAKPTDNYPFGFLPEDENGGYGLKKDPWGASYRLHTEGEHYRVYSVGPNGVDEGGKGDDIALEG